MADPQTGANETVVIGDRYVYFNLPAWKGAGVAVPVFSLRSEKSFGVGDFGDLKRMIDWAVSTKQKAVQILPINDTTMTHTWTDSYPYNSISIYAFHPMYTDLKQLGTLKDKKAMAEFNKRQKELNALPAVDYEAVNKTKWEYFHLIFKQEGEKVLASAAFREFFETNKEWLQPYAVFSYLRDAYKTPDFREWPKYGSYDAAEIEKLCQPESADYPHIAIYYYIQFNLHLQLLAATGHARANGVVLKGDIPIGISRNSVEAWTEPHYFNLNGQAGAPPDDFSVNGQNWGFPTYNWDIMEKDGYAWWMKRFRKMAEYFDAYRIDHILGFFRIWEIPMHAVHGLLGQFVPALPMTREEIESYGLSFREEFLKPYIHEYFLGQMFGPHTDYVKQTFIEPTDTWEIYRMRPEFDTQRKVEAYFAGKTDEDSIWIRDGLYALISDVLFVPDRNDPYKYHPRIGVQHDYIYRSLNDWEKAAFNRLYDQYYYHRHNEFWREQAMNKLPQLTQSTRMLVCGEDLGMIPDCVAWVMNDLRILSLEIQRMPKDPAQEFGHPDWYPYRSVCTISTHDMSTLRGWWEEDFLQTQRYYNTMLGHYGAAPAVATPELCEEVVRKHLYSNSILCILSLQDWMSMDGKWRNPNEQEERINVPANPRHYWRWRMHLTLEQLMKAESLNEKIKELIVPASGHGYLRQSSIHSLCDEECIAVESSIFSVQFFLIGLKCTELLGNLIPGIFGKKNFLSRTLGNEVMLRPAIFRQNKRSDRQIPCSVHLSHLIRNRIYFGIRIHPIIVNLRRTFVRKPRALGYGDIAARLQILTPLVQPTLKTDIVDSSFRPNQVQFPFLERKIIHQADNPFHPVLQSGLPCVAIKDIDKTGEKIKSRNLPGRMLCQYHCLAACSATEVGNERLIRKIIDKAQCFQRYFGTSGPLTFHGGKEIAD